MAGRWALRAKRPRRAVLRQRTGALALVVQRVDMVDTMAAREANASGIRLFEKSRM